MESGSAEVECISECVSKNGPPSDEVVQKTPEVVIGPTETTVKQANVEGHGVAAASATPVNMAGSNVVSRPNMGVALSAAIGSLLYGYDTGIIGSALLYLEVEFHLEKQPVVQGGIVSAALVGAVIGTAATGPASDAMGRRGILLLAALLFTLGGIAMGLSQNVPMLIASRALAGVAIGTVSSAVPVFIAECSPSAARGRLATLPQLFVSSGILLSYCTAFGLSLSGEGVPQWRLMLGLSVAPALLFAILVWFLPESPRWLCLRGRRSEALRAAARLGLPPGELPAEAEVEKERADHWVPKDDLIKGGEMGSRSLEDGRLPPGTEQGHLLQAAREEGDAVDQESGIEAEGQAVGKTGGSSVATLLGEMGRDVRELFTHAALRKALLVGVGLQLFQQLCGINAVVYYTPEILRSAGAVHLLPFAEKSASILATILAYSLKIPTIFLAMALMDSAGRRSLLLGSIPLMLGSLTCLACAFGFLASGPARAALSMITVAVYGCSFVIGLGPIPTIVCSEIFPTHLRGSAVGFCVAVNFICNVIVSTTFPPMMQAMGGPVVFALFSGICALAWVFVYTCVPETKRMRLEATAELFEHQYAS